MTTKSSDHHDHPGFSVEVEKKGPTVASVRFSVTGEEYQRARKTGLKNAAKRTRLKGFRPGKAPAQMMEKMFGAEIDRELVQHFVQHAYEHAVQDEGLRPAAQPRIELEGVARTEDGGLEHEFEVLLRPEIQLGEIEGMEVESPVVQVGDEELEAALGDLRNQFSRPEPAGEAGLPADGVAVCRLEFLLPDEPEPILDREGIRLGPKAAPPGVDEAAFEEALTGAREGETRELPFTFTDEFPVEEARGKEGTLRVRLDQALRVVRPEDEELFKVFEVEDEAGLRTAVTERIRGAKEEQENHRLQNVLLEKLINDHPIEVPEALVDNQVQARTAELEKALEQQGLSGKELEDRLQAETAQAREASVRSLKAVYLMEEIAKQKELLVTQEDIEGELQAIAGRNQVEVGEVRKYYQEEGLLQQLGLELLERKVRSFLLESADIRQVQEAR